MGGGVNSPSQSLLSTFPLKKRFNLTPDVLPGGFRRAVAERQPIELVEMADGKGKNTTPLRQAQGAATDKHSKKSKSSKSFKSQKV